MYVVVAAFAIVSVLIVAAASILNFYLARDGGEHERRRWKPKP